MGNASTKERPESPSNGHHASSSRRQDRGNGESSHLGRLAGLGGDRIASDYSGRGRSRHNLEQTLFGLGVTSTREQRERDREAEKAAREQRRIEREKERQKERERSLREDRVDGGFLVTQGVYTGTEDFKDRIVRSFMIERRLAPFFKGLPDHEDDWTDAQLVAAVRGLPIPSADAELPPRDTASTLVKSSGPASSTDNLTVPIASRSRAQSYNSDASNRSASIPSSSRARSKTLSISSPKNPTLPTTAGPVEIKTQSEYVDGRPIEAVLYKNALECPICFLYYPPYMNKTRCCDQGICSECFVQIKRADPHLPEHHDHQPPASAEQAASTADQLISEASTCPFCKQTDFGVTYNPPAFRTGIVYANQPYSSVPSPRGADSGLSNTSSTTSLNNLGSSPVASPLMSPGGRRRMTLARDAPEVVTTDMIRPDWAQKLATARSHAARRAAAATALHTAAFLMNPQPNVGSSSSGGFPGRRLMRRTRENSGNGSDSPSPGGSGAGTPREDTSTRLQGLMRTRGDSTEDRLAALGFAVGREGRREPSRGGGLLDVGNSRRSRMVDLEEMMLMEAIRLSLAEEEERKRKEDEEEERKGRETEEAAARLLGSNTTNGGVEGKGKSVDRPTSPAAGSSSRGPYMSSPLASSTNVHVPSGNSSSSDASSFASVQEGRSDTPGDRPENAGSAEDSMFNFHSLAEMIIADEGGHKKDEEAGESGHVEHVEEAPVDRDGIPVVSRMVQPNGGHSEGKFAEITMERVHDEQAA